MKKNPLLFVFVSLFIIYANIFSQDFNTYTPPADLYLFSSYDEGANAFRYNPAILGLKHKFNAAFSLYLRNTFRNTGYGGFDVSLNAGIVGLGFRSVYENQASFDFYPQNIGGFSAISYSYESYINTLSLGLGFGNKTISGGILGEYLSQSYIAGQEDFNDPNPRFSFSLGLLYRPSPFISVSYVFKSPEALSVNYNLSYRNTLGLAVRPFSNNRLTVLADFSVFPYRGTDLFNVNQVKAGAEIKITDGLFASINYTRNNSEIKNEFINVGFRLNFPHSSIRYNQTLNNSNTIYNNNPGLPNDDLFYNYSGGGKYRTILSQISLAYTFEKQKSFVPEPKKIIEIVLSGSLQDYNTEDVFFGILGSGKRSVHEVIADIDYAAGDPSVKGMLLKIYPLATGRFEVNAAIEELTASLERFKNKKKSITAYLPQDTGPAEYYIATFANDIILPPDALFFYGLSIEVFNYKQFLNKYGIELQNFYAGEYKLTFQGILDSTSAQGKEVINRILDVVYDKMLSRTVTARNLVLDDFLRDKLSKPITGMEAYRLGLVDRNGWYDDAKNLAEKNAKTDNIVKRINRSEWDEGWGEPEQIAIIGVYGTIKPGESEGPSAVTLPIPYIGGGRATGSETVLRQLENAFANPKVRAIILRVDSGGGSALASSEINDAIIRLRKKYKKPFIVSMGNAAASGGYYVSVNADRIFSDDLTVTGSIGVWASRPNLDSLMRDQNVKVEIFKRGENSDIGSFFRKLNDEDIEIIQGIIDFYYDRFITAVSEGRKISKEEAEAFAKGRVWLGTDAFSKKLVDEIGGLYQAVVYAKKKSGIDTNRFNLVYYAVPGGNSVNDLVTQSIVQYIQLNLLNMFWQDEDSNGLEIKY